MILSIQHNLDQINPANSSSLRKSSLKAEYLNKLEEAIVEGTNKKAWKSSLHAITMKFKDLKLEAKVVLEGGDGGVVRGVARWRGGGGGGQVRGG